MFRSLNIFPYRHLIFHKAYADFRAESERTYLGLLWWILEPLINMAIYYLVFGIILQRGRGDFVPFLIVGLVVWRWYEMTVKQAARAILKNVSLVRQVGFRKIVFPLCVVVTNSFQFIFSLALMFVVLALCGYTIQIHLIAFPVLLLVEFLFILAIALPLCAVVPFLPDLGNFVEYVLRIQFYLSGVFFAAESLNWHFQRWLDWNPMVGVVKSFRDVLMYARWPDWDYLLVIALLSLIGIYVGAELIAAFDKVYAKRVT